MRRGARSVRGRDGPAPTPCVQAQCFDPLVRLCVACRLFRTPEPGRASPPSGLRSLPSFPRPLSPSPPHAPAAGLSSQAPGTALQPQESVGAGAEAVLPLPGLLFGAPALLGLALALALALVALMSWRWQRRRRTASLEAPDGGQDADPGHEGRWKGEQNGPSDAQILHLTETRGWRHFIPHSVIQQILTEA
ncbi:tumor necrosis factor receptor superfamily member 13C isoform X2 [Ictidomys tridecemlineatus]